VGRAVLQAVKATRCLVETNTNLGMILLLAPMAAVPMGSNLQTGVQAVLEATSAQDALLVYQAIRLARPGGLGTVEDQDVADEPTLTLREAMTLAADRDLIARQYANGFTEVFDAILPTLRASIGQGQPLETAIILAALRFQAGSPDTLIARKLGPTLAVEASSRAAKVLAAGWPDTAKGDDALVAFDQWLRDDGHARNPGATADLVTAGLFAALRDGTIQLPIAGVWSNAIPRNLFGGEPRDRPTGPSATRF